MTNKHLRFTRIPDRRLARGFDRVIFYEFDLLERHRQQVANFFAQAAEENQRYMENIKNRLGEDDPYWDWLTDDHHELTTLLPRIQWNSQFIAAYATFEDALNRLAKVARARLNLKLQPKDIGHQGIERAHVYLSKVAGVTRPFLTSEWVVMKAFGDLRNAIAHAGAELNVKESKGAALMEKLATWPGAALNFSQEDDIGRVTLGPEFLRFAIETMGDFVRKIGNTELELDDDAEWVDAT